MQKIVLSLKFKLLIWVLPILLAGMLLMGFVAFSYMITIIESELTSSKYQGMARTAESIDRWFKTLMLEPETIASTPAAKNINVSFDDFDIQNINRHMVLHEKYPDIFEDIYGSNREGVYHTVIREKGEIQIFEGNIANRPYFISIMNGGPTQITPPLISRTTGIPTVFIVAPITDEYKTPQGLVGTGIALNYIQQFVNEMESEQGGFGFIYTPQGNLVAHSSVNAVIEKKVHLLDLFLDTLLVQNLLSNQDQVFRHNYDNKDVFIFLNPIPATGWNLASVIFVSELFAPAQQMIRILVIIAFITILITTGSVYYAMEKLISPLKSFVSMTGEIASGNYCSGDIPIISKDEIGVLADSFNRMKNNLQNSIEQLKKSEDNYREIFENSMEGIVQTTINGQIITANPAVVEMLHCSSFEVLINSYRDIQNQFYNNPDDRERIINCLYRDGSIKNKEVQVRCCDGELIWVSLSSFLVRDSSGEPLRIESLLSDITRRKEIEIEKEKLFQELVQSQKLEAVGKLAGGVAHDFNNMLAAILGRTELALMKIDKSDPYFEVFTEIYDAAQHSANLTKQLLAFARKQSVSPESIVINTVIKSMLKLLRRLITENVELVFHPQQDLWQVFMDPDQIGQILTNLCVNARDSIEGSGRVKITTENLTINNTFMEVVEGILPGDYVCLSIEDSGAGMNEETLQHIFEPFFTTKEQGKGTGLGLSTIYGIVKQNHSYINVYSEVGTGSIFRIYIPRYKGNAELDKTSSVERVLTVSCSVLLVEDDDRLLGITKVILESLGARVFAAASPEEALAVVGNRANHIDLLLTDVIMPEMNGYELYTAISRLRTDIKSLFMSGYSAEILAPEGILEKGINFIQKPFSLNGLADKINEILGRK